MTHRIDVARGRDVVARWCTLAEQRLEYLTELFETGRWRRFHSELAFLENIQEAKAAVETWRDLLTRQASPDNSASDVSWAGRARTALRRDDALRDQAPKFRPALPPLEASTASNPVHVFSGDAPSAPDSNATALDNASEPMPDLAVMHQRYPLLHNAL